MLAGSRQLLTALGRRRITNPSFRQLQHPHLQTLTCLEAPRPSRLGTHPVQLRCSQALPCCACHNLSMGQLGTHGVRAILLCRSTRQQGTVPSARVLGNLMCMLGCRPKLSWMLQVRQRPKRKLLTLQLLPQAGPASHLPLHSLRCPSCSERAVVLLWLLLWHVVRYLLMALRLAIT